MTNTVETFATPKVTEDTQAKHENIAGAFREFADKIDGSLYPSRELSLVKTKLEEAAQWAHKAIERAEGEFGTQKAAKPNNEPETPTNAND